ncbi:hypothetical protein [Streptomyces hokutonensis]|uniref:hypothetical protein n=1 Tax=Streptomyces hokutonensis TaxID=1306990 RepID=UPI0036CF6AFD
MNTLTGVQLAGAAAEHGRTLLGETYEVWRVAGILAVVAAVGYEMAMALTRLIGLRLPFLVLYIARLTTPKSEWPYLYKAWKGELHAILDASKGFWVIKSLKGLKYALPLALGAARLTAKIREVRVKQAHHRSSAFEVVEALRFSVVTATFIGSGVLFTLAAALGVPWWTAWSATWVPFLFGIRLSYVLGPSSPSPQDDKSHDE